MVSLASFARPEVSSVNEEMHLRPQDLLWDDHLMREIAGSIRDAVTQWDEHRLLILMPLGHNSEPKARVTIPAILDQAKECNLKVDMLLGLNNGALLPRLHDDLSVREDIQFHETFTAPSWADEHGHDVLRAIPRSVAVSAIEDAKEDVNRVMFIRQESEPGSAGKNRMLKAIADIAIRSMREGSWQKPPALTLDMDDDGQLFVEGNPLANGLAELLKEQKLRAWHAIGSRMTTVPFHQRDGLAYPCINAPEDERYSYLDQASRDWSPFLPGCASIGQTSTFLTARQLIGHRYPGSLVDDLHRTILVRRTGERWGVSSQVHSFNERRSEDDTQLMRWMRGTLSLYHAFGREASNAQKPFLRTFPPKLAAIVERILREKHSLSLNGDSAWNK